MAFPCRRAGDAGPALLRAARARSRPADGGAVVCRGPDAGARFLQGAATQVLVRRRPLPVHGLSGTAGAGGCGGGAAPAAARGRLRSARGRDRGPRCGGGIHPGVGTLARGCPLVAGRKAPRAAFAGGHWGDPRHLDSALYLVFYPCARPVGLDPHLSTLAQPCGGQFAPRSSVDVLPGAPVLVSTCQGAAVDRSAGPGPGAGGVRCGAGQSRCTGWRGGSDRESTIPGAARDREGRGVCCVLRVPFRFLPEISSPASMW